MTRALQVPAVPSTRLSLTLLPGSSRHWSTPLSGVSACVRVRVRVCICVRMCACRSQSLDLSLSPSFDLSLSTPHRTTHTIHRPHDRSDYDQRAVCRLLPHTSTDLQEATFDDVLLTLRTHSTRGLAAAQMAVAAAAALERLPRLVEDAMDVWGDMDFLTHGNPEVHRYLSLVRRKETQTQTEGQNEEVGKDTERGRQRQRWRPTHMHTHTLSLPSFSASRVLVVRWAVWTTGDCAWCAALD